MIGRRGEALREGLRLAIIGPPNAGKSSLINALARRDTAIVSEIPGTTRDVIELRLNLGGYLVHVADTAGLRETKDADRGRRRAPRPGPGARQSSGAAAAGRQLIRIRMHATSQPDLVVWNKSDLPAFRKRRRTFAVAEKRRRPASLIGALTALVAERLETKDRNACPHPAAPSPGAGRSAADRCVMRCNRRGSRNCSPKICAWPCAPSAASPARWMSRNSRLRVQGFCIGK